MDGSFATPSAILLEANQKLHVLREQIKDRQQLTESVGSQLLPTAGLPWTAGSSSADASGTETLLPRHLGWGSTALTAVLRREQQLESPVEKEASWFHSLQSQSDLSSYNREDVCTPIITPQQTSPLNHSPEGNVKLYPDIGLGLLRQEMTAPGRLWLMLRYLDKKGRGSIRIAIVTNLLSTPTSELRFCGNRQLRNLLKDGEGIFWTRDKTTLWLRSVAKVATALSIERLTGQPVAIPVKAILEGIGTFRAHLYTAFHSSRTKETAQGEQVMPIARATLVELSGVGRSSQRAYEARVGVQVQTNFAVGHLATKENKEKQAWQHGTALFELKDFRGQQGKKGKVYLAWQLPNSYVGQHEHRPKGRQKRINRELKDLVMKGMPGNVVRTDEMQKPEKLYFPNGKLATKSYSRNPKQVLYWKRDGVKNGRSDLWQQLGNM